MFLFVSIVNLLIGSSLGATGRYSNRFTALKFADDANSYVQYTTDWSPFANVFSACVWVRDLGSAPHRPVYFKPPDELIMTADGSYSTVVRSYQQLQSNMTVSKGTWYHQCSTWSSSTRVHRVYVDGVEIGAKRTASGRSITSTGALTIGNYAGGHNSRKFGGEMAYLNFYNKELSASDIARMAQQGMCSNIAGVDKNESFRLIKWEYLLELGRSGTVTDLAITECWKALLEEFFEADKLEKEQELENLSTKLNSTVAELKESQADKVEKEQELENLSTKLNSTVAELKESQADKVEKEQELENLSTKLNSTVAELKESQADKVEKEQELENLSTKLNSTVAELKESQADKVEKEQELENLSTKLNSTVAELKESQADKVEKEQKLEDVSNRLNSTQEELKESQADQLEKEQKLEDVSNRLNSTQEELKESQADQLEKEKELEDISARLNSTVAELEEVTANRNASWDWDVFLSEQFLDQNFTAEHSQLLRSTWDDIAGTESI